MKWATKRKLQYFGILAFFLILFVVVPLYFFVYQKPTCFDGLKNGEELGVDCGGSCKLLCSAEIVEPISRWDPRVFKVSAGSYNVVAYLENPNVSAEVLNAPYTFKFYDKDGLFIAERKGKTFIPKGKSFAIFDGNFSFGDREPVKATFSFDGNLVWTKNRDSIPDIKVSNKSFSIVDSKTPRVDATIVNDSLNTVSNVELTVIVFDGSGNAIGTSRTFVEKIQKGEEKSLVFTWPEPFVTRQEICDLPVDVALIIDRSGSMDDLGSNPPQPLTDVKNAATYFVNQLSQNDQVTVISFANEASTPIDSLLSKDKTSAKDSISKIFIATSTTQNTNILDGLSKAFGELTSTRHNPSSGTVMVLLTDGVATRPEKSGDPKFPESSAILMANEAKGRGIKLFSIGLGKDLNVEFLKQIASSSNEFYLAPTSKDLTKIYKEIATKICIKKPASVEIIPKIYPAEFSQ